MGWRGFGPWRRELQAFLELFALCGVAVAQPTFDLLAKNAGAFVTLRSSQLHTVGLVLLVLLAPATLLWCVEVLVGIAAPRSRPWVHATLAAGVVTVLGVEALKHQTELAPIRLLVLGAVLGLAGGALVLRSSTARLWLRYLAIAPVIFAVLFLTDSPVTAVVFDKGPASTAGVTIGKPHRIVMIVFDEMPLESILDGNGHVDAALFPNLAALERTSTWYRNDTTVAPYTDEAVPAILTGDYPTGTYVPPVAGAYPHNLFTLLGGRFRLNVHESISHLCPDELCPYRGATVDDPFGSLVDTTYSLWSDFATPKRLPTTLNAGKTHTDQQPLQHETEFVDTIRPSTRPELDFLHILLPHQPWHLRGTQQDDGWLQPARGMVLNNVWSGAWAATSARQRHLLQVQAADTLVGQVVAKLRSIGAYDDSMIVVTADHGVAFTAGHSYRGASAETYPQILWTPLFVRRPGQTTGVIDDRPTRSIDVFPTIADLIDARVPWKTDGHSMARAEHDPGSPRLFHWNLNELKPPAGQDYLTFSGDTGFLIAKQGRASDADGAADLRLYRIGPYGGLVGRAVAPLVDEQSPGAAGSLSGPSVLEHVDPAAPAIPWSFVQGDLKIPTSGVNLAVSVNGVVAGVTQSQVTNRYSGESEFWCTLPPELFRRGRNTIGVSVIQGPPGAPRLVPVRLTR